MLSMLPLIRGGDHFLARKELPWFRAHLRVSSQSSIISVEREQRVARWSKVHQTRASRCNFLASATNGTRESQSFSFFVVPTTRELKTWPDTRIIIVPLSFASVPTAITLLATYPMSGSKQQKHTQKKKEILGAPLVQAGKLSAWPDVLSTHFFIFSKPVVERG